MKRILHRPHNEEVAHWPATWPQSLKAIIAARGITDARELNTDLTQLLPYHQLAEIDRAASIIANAVIEDKHILLVGDFDCDGATSTAVAIKALKAMGALHVDFTVPDRFKFGYGLSPAIVDSVLDRQPELIITVDNGIASIDGVAAAKAQGWQVVVTDHHLAPKVLPAADAIVNPNQPGDQFASKCLAGVGVIFYVMLAVRAALKAKGWFIDQGLAIPNLGDLLDIVALGTVADVVPLDRNNRVLVAQGLARVQAGRACPGVRALAHVAKRNLALLSSQDLGFYLGPRLNAAGRIDDMSVGIRCLLAEDMATALPLAQQLDQLNYERRHIENDMREQAAAALDKLELSGALPSGLCLYHADWHQGVVGLLAGRIKEQTHRPVICFAEADADSLKGSARSIPGIHMRDLLDEIATEHPELLQKFGGHAMAAGLSLLKIHLNEFKQLFDKKVIKYLNGRALEGVIDSDGALPMESFELDFARLLNGFVWGQGFPAPLFDNTFDIVDQRVVGEKHLKLKLKHPEGSKPFDAIWFNADMQQWPNAEAEQIHCAYRLEINEFNDLQRLQLVVEQAEAVTVCVG